MHNDLRILVVYSSFGDGHLQAANALRSAFAAKGVHQVLLVDLLQEAHPFLNTVSRMTYLKSSVYCPKLYGLSYDWTNRGKPGRLFNQWLHKLGARKIKAVVDQLKPDAVIHTFPFLAIPQSRSDGGRPLPSYTVITDFVLHNRWLHSHTDRYFVATESLKLALLEAGVEEGKVTVSGIPVRASFAHPPNRSEVLKKYGLPEEEKYVLLSAGAYGVLSHVKEAVRHILDRTDCRVILVCGRNRKRQAEMESAFSSDTRIHIYGYIQEMNELMAAASCLVTKAGGITLAEGMAMRLPIVVYRALPGQEHGNARTLASQGAVLTAEHPHELVDQIRNLDNPAFRHAIVRAMTRLGRRDASSAIVAEILLDLKPDPAIPPELFVSNERNLANAFR